MRLIIQTVEKQYKMVKMQPSRKFYKGLTNKNKSKTKSLWKSMDQAFLEELVLGEKEQFYNIIHLLNKISLVANTARRRDLPKEITKTVISK